MGNRLARFGRFNFVGAGGAAVQLAIFHLLSKYFELSTAASVPIAVEVAVLHNFIWHERFTWRDRSGTAWAGSAVRLFRFQAANGLVSAFGNTAAIYFLVEWLHVPELLAAAGAIAVCAPVNFAVADRWVYPVIRRAGKQSDSSDSNCDQTDDQKHREDVEQNL